MQQFAEWFRDFAEAVAVLTGELMGVDQADTREGLWYFRAGYSPTLAADTYTLDHSVPEGVE